MRIIIYVPTTGVKQVLFLAVSVHMSVSLCVCLSVWAKTDQEAQLPQRQRASNIALSYGANGISICWSV